MYLHTHNVTPSHPDILQLHTLTYYTFASSHNIPSHPHILHLHTVIYYTFTPSHTTPSHHHILYLHTLTYYTFTPSHTRSTPQGPIAGNYPDPDEDIYESLPDGAPQEEGLTAPLPPPNLPAGHPTSTGGTRFPPPSQPPPPPPSAAGTHTTILVLPLFHYVCQAHQFTYHYLFLSCIDNNCECKPNRTNKNKDKYFTMVAVHCPQILFVIYCHATIAKTKKLEEP